MSRITNDVKQVQQAVSETVGDLLREGLSLIGFAGLLFYYDAGSRSSSSPARRSSSIRSCNSASASAARAPQPGGARQMSHITAEAFTGHRIVKAFGAEAHEAVPFKARRIACIAPT